MKKPPPDAARCWRRALLVPGPGLGDLRGLALDLHDDGLPARHGVVRVLREEEQAVDALLGEDALRLLGFTGQSDWSLPRTLHRLEAFNGFGYRRYGRPSPYLWSFSTLYERGKFVADGRYDPRARSQQCGTATMLKLLDLAGELDLTA